MATGWRGMVIVEQLVVAVLGLYGETLAGDKIVLPVCLVRGSIVHEFRGQFGLGHFLAKAGELL